MRLWPRWWRWLGFGLGGALVAGAVFAATQREVSAWTGIAAISDPATAIATAKANGVDRLAVFVNDSSFTAGAWRTYDPAAVVACCAAIRGAGLRASLVSWMTPRPDWIGQGARELGELARAAGVDEIDLDLEEPWTVIRAWSDAHIKQAVAELFANLRSGFGGKVWVDCIVGADLRALGPAIEASDGVIPQAYRVAANAGFPDIEARALAKYRPFGKPVALGVAAYWSSKPFELADPGTVRRALANAAALGVRRVRIWRLEFLRPAVGAEFVAFKRGDTEPRAAA